MPTLEEQFLAAVEIIQNLPKEGPIQPTIPEKLRTYAWFKQATIGPCTEEKPSIIHPIDRMKWSAWQKLGNMSKQDAMAHYVQEFLEKCDKAEMEVDIITYLNDPKSASILHLEPMFRKNFEILGRSSSASMQGKEIQFNGTQIRL